MAIKTLSSMTLTDAQRKWLEAENVRTGASFANLIRGLIQDKIDKKAA